MIFDSHQHFWKLKIIKGYKKMLNKTLVLSHSI